MTLQHPITPPTELVQQWDDEGTEMFRPEYQQHLATRAAQWGADQELEACCEWLQDPDLNVDTYKLRVARRPKPPSLKEQALLALNKLPPNRDCGVAHDIIRRALEQLDA